jgi:hypothetical protein
VTKRSRTPVWNLAGRFADRTDDIAAGTEQRAAKEIAIGQRHAQPLSPRLKMILRD